MARFLQIDFGSRSVKFYPLTIGQIQELDEEMKVMVGVRTGDNPFDPDRFSKLTKIYTASAQRGDPTITEEIIKEIVDLSNINLVNTTVLGLSTSKETGGENVPMSPQTGGVSTHG